MRSPALAALGLAVILGFVLYRARRSSPQNAGKPSPLEVYQGLRGLALKGSRAQFGLAPASSPVAPWGAIMDWSVTNGTATVLALSDGHASIYLSNGGGFLGGAESYESVKKAAKTMVTVASEVQPQTHLTKEYPLPEKGQVFFYLLTDSGVFAAHAAKQDLKTHRHPFWKVGDAAQDVIKQYRLIQSAKQQ